MKRVVSTIETDVDGLDSLLGEYVELFCLNYMYAGKLIGVNTDTVCLAECRIVYETGKLSDHSAYKFSELFGTDERFVTRAHIESFGPAPKLVQT